MRRTQMFSIVVFVIAVVSFAVFQFRSYVLTDRTGPSIAMEEERVTVSVDADDGQLLAGISAMDDKDGDVSDSLMVESLSNFIAENTRQMTFAASDSDGHVVKGYREIVYSDYRSPRFSLTQPLRFRVGTENILEGVGAQDVLDGDISSNIKISANYSLSINQAGDYPMEFTVANSAGDVARLPVTVTLYTAEDEANRPQIELSDYLVYTPAGAELDAWDYVQGITVRGTEFVRSGDVLRADDPEERAIDDADLSIQDDVDYQTPGAYEITYRYTADDGETGTVRLVVVVTD